MKRACCYDLERGSGTRVVGGGRNPLAIRKHPAREPWSVGGTSTRACARTAN
jgi:hypothetical protein